MLFPVVATSALAILAVAEISTWRFHADHVLGTSLDVTAVSDNRATAMIAVSALRAEINRLEMLLSNWRTDSEIARLNAAETMPVSPDLYAVLTAAARWRERTAGAFDERLGAISQLWRQASSAGEATIDRTLLATRLEAARQPLITKDDGRTVTRPAGLLVGTDGLAKGFIVDAALDAARRVVPGLRGLMIDIGGDIRCWGQAPTAAGWQVGVSRSGCLDDNAAPSQILNLIDQAVATSGPGARDLQIGDRTVSHLLSPFSGMPAKEVTSATVVAGTAADADAFATALAIMPAGDGIALADRLPGIEASVTTRDGFSLDSRGWSGLRVAQSSTPAQIIPVQARAQREQPWPSGFALQIQYEVPTIRGGTYRRPYLAIWISDERQRVVRTVLLLGRRPYWQDSNYLWWRRQGPDATAVVEAISRPTRAPGRYTTTWDGKDDDGRPVPPGRYTVNIEAVRQFGGHTAVSRTLSLGTEPLEQSIPADDEIGATRLRYGRSE